MSKAAKRSLLILIVILLVTLVFAGITVIGKQNVEAEKVLLEKKLTKTQDQFLAKEKKYVQDAQKLNTALKSAEEEKASLGRKVKKVEEMRAKAEDRLREISTEVSDIAMDRDKWKRRIDTIREERDALMSKIASLNEELAKKPEPEIVYKEVEKKVEVEKIVEAEKKEEKAPALVAAPPAVDLSTAPPILMDSGKVVDEEYWANLLQEKASLEIDIGKLKDELSEKSIEIVELKQGKEDLELQFDALKSEKEGLEAAMQHKSDMIDSISLELARTKNDKKFIADRVGKLNAENGSLRTQMKQLTNVKNALEKSIVRLSREKDKVEGKLGKTETLIQSKIDEIWEIKDDLDRSIREAQPDAASNSGVELPPIVVSSDGQPMQVNKGSAGFNGHVISINETNNFVIVDIGENKGINLGDSLSVYRDSKYIARLEVIQVRKDIAAADLKDQWSKVKVGDVIR